MFIGDMNWMQVERQVQLDDRVLLPLGSTEQHAYLSLMTDVILAQRVAIEAAEPLGLPVFPALPYGMTPYFGDFPGTVSLRPATYFALLVDVLDSLHQQGFRRILLVNGHGGNCPVQAEIQQWLCRHPQARVKLHNWWSTPRTLAKVREIDALASHASWMENFPWTRIPGQTPPEERKPMVDLAHLRQLGAQAVRAYIGDGNYGGAYHKDDALMQELWQVGVEETREQLQGGWAE
ncbi:creatininase family protein [Pseudomonas citronellolis]|uniref:creatininase family protein n=1 Tax=Pseudomonas citronellolis TaxID=53408 RepID=UPI002FDA89D6